MILTLSERRLSELIRQLENINDNDEEILYRMKHYASKLFSYVGEYGIRMVEMVSHSGGIGSFRFDISGVGRDYRTGDFNWDRLRDGLNLVNPVGITMERSDIWAICTGLVAKGLNDVWYDIAPNLERLSVSEFQPTLEAWLQHTVFGAGRGDASERTA